MLGVTASGSQMTVSAPAVVTPPDRISVTAPHLYVVGTSTASRVALSVNDGPADTVVVNDTVFHAAVTFGYGVNRIAVWNVTAGELSETPDTVFIEIMYDPRRTKRYEQLYESYRFHASSREDACVTCHPTIASEREPGDTTVACLSCHGFIRTTFRRHTRKAGDAACVMCHPRGNGPRLSSGEQENVCLQCHQEKRGMFSEEYLHGPVAAGGCSVCHDPHGSAYDYSLVSPVAILCLSCHPEMEPESKREVVHPPFAKGRCDACHDPHAAAYRWQLTKGSQQLCMTCHTEDGDLARHAHPYNVVPSGPLSVPLQLTPRGELECLSCHNPHAADAPHLLRVSQEFICIGCHEGKQ